MARDVIGELLIKIRADIQELKAGLNQASGMTASFAKEAQKQTETVKSAIGGLKTSYVALAAAVYGAMRTVREATDLAKIGAQAEQVRESFETLTRSLGVNGRELIRQMKETGAVFVDETELMVKAQRLLVERVSPEEIVRLMEAARVASRLMGTSVSESFDLIAEAVTRLQVRGIKAAFPMDVQQVIERYARSIGTVGSRLTETGQRAAILGEVLRQAAEKKSLLKDLAQPTTAEQIQKVASAWQQLKEEVGLALLELVKTSDLLPTLMEFVKALIAGAKAVGGLREEFKMLGPIVKAVLVAIGAVGTGIATIIAGLYEANFRLLQLLDTVTLRKIPLLRQMVEDFGKRNAAVQQTFIDQATALSEFIAGKRQEAAKTSEKEASLYSQAWKKLSREEQIDMVKAGRELTKLRLANLREQTAAIAAAEKERLERQMILEVEAARQRGEAVGPIELKWKRALLDQDYRASLEQLRAKREAEEEEARQQGLEVSSIRNKFLAMQQAAEEKYRAEIAKLDQEAAEYARKVAADRLEVEEKRLSLQLEMQKAGLEAQREIELSIAERTGRDRETLELQWRRRLAEEEYRQALALLELKREKELNAAREAGRDIQLVNAAFAAEREKLEVDLAQKISVVQEQMAARAAQLALARAESEARFREELAELLGDYETLTEAQARRLEQEKQSFMISQEWARLDAENQELYIQLMDTRIKKLREQRALESLRDLADYRRQLAELVGDWQGMAAAEADALMFERDYILATKALTDEQRRLIEVIYERRIAESEAYRNLQISALMQRGLNEKIISSTREVGDAFRNFVGSAVDRAADAMSTFLENIASGTKSTKDAFKELWNDFAAAIRRMAVEVTMLIAKMLILRALGGTLGGAEEGGLIAGMQTGGIVRGPAGRDQVPIRATAGEYVQPVQAVKYYGVGVMEAIRTRKIPKSVFEGYDVGGLVNRPAFAFQEGGLVTGGRAPIQLTMINVTDPRELDRYLASAEGQNAVVNVIASRAQTVKRLLR